MRRNHGDAAFERQSEDARVGKRAANDRNGMFATRVRQQGKLRFGHAIPEGNKTPVVAVDVLAVRQAFHHHRAGFNASVQFLERIGPRRVNRHRR